MLFDWNLGPVFPESGLDRTDELRNFDPYSLMFSFRGDPFNLPAMASELRGSMVRLSGGCERTRTGVCWIPSVGAQRKPIAVVMFLPGTASPTPSARPRSPRPTRSAAAS